MYKIDLLRQIEANTRGSKTLSDCYSKYDLWRMIERNTRSKPNPPYQLDNGTWDMSHRELVSFSRSTKAWLDGKEYAVDTPRYLSNGQLLIEGQNTNYMPTPFPYDTFAFRSSDPLTTRTVTAVDGWSDYSVSLASGSGYFDIEYSATLNNTLMSVQLTVKKTDDYSFLISGHDTTAGGEWAFLFVANQPHPTAENLIVIDNGDNFTITASEHFKEDGYAKFRVFPNRAANSTRSLVFKDLMTILGDKPTSHIPTNGTAVTRAADIAIVRDAQ